jgi:beta-ribofuranosylaminobenzene 5'-phosphate synthase
MDQSNLFDPGENLVRVVPQRKATPVRESVTVKFPARIHISPIDCNRFAFGMPGGGGVGFAVEMENWLTVSVAEKDSIACTQRHKPLLAHWLDVARDCFAYQGGLSVSVTTSEAMGQHSGLGSSAVLAVGCLQAVNLLFGEPLSQNDVRRTIAHNFVEECYGRLARGLETGVGTYAVLYGGLCIIGDRIAPVYHSRTLDGYPVLLVQPDISRPDLDKPESAEMLKRSFELDASYRYVRAYRTIMDIVPYLYEGNIEGFGKVVWDFQFSGTHISMIQSYDRGGVDLWKIMTMLREAGAEVVGMSSVGPTIFALAKDLSPLVSMASSAGLKQIVTAVAPAGVVATAAT